VVLTILKNMKVNGKDYPIYYGKMFETTNQLMMAQLSIQTNPAYGLLIPAGIVARRLVGSVMGL
jgi:hypothetical protein